MITHITSSSHLELQSNFWREFQREIEALSKKTEIYIWLSGWTSFDIFYDILRENFWTLESWIREKIRFCLLDERVVPVDHPDSNLWQLRIKFLDFLIDQGYISENQILGIGYTDHIAKEYSESLPCIDIWLFWVGGDGHIASLFPHHPLLESEEKNYLEIMDSPKPPSHRITISPNMIVEIGSIFIAFMRGKEVAYVNLCDESVSIDSCPAKLVQRGKNVFIIKES